MIDLKTAKTISTDTLIVFVLDETGSMGPLRRATIESFNAFLRDQKALGGDCRLSLTLFDTARWNPRYVAKPLPEVEDLSEKNYQPGGGTPLYDAIFRAVESSETWLTANAWNEKVLLVIQTDGEENASQTHPGASGRLDVKALLERKQGEGWTVVFLGAGIDAVKFSEAHSIPRGNTMSYAANPQDHAHAVHATSGGTTTYRTTTPVGQSSDSFFAAPTTDDPNLQPFFGPAPAAGAGSSATPLVVPPDATGGGSNSTP